MTSERDDRLPAGSAASPQGAIPDATPTLAGGPAPLEIVDPVFDPCPTCGQAVTSVHFDGLDSGAPFTWVGPCGHQVQNANAAYEVVPTRTYDIRFRHFTYQAFEGTERS